MIAEIPVTWEYGGMVGLLLLALGALWKKQNEAEKMAAIKGEKDEKAAKEEAAATNAKLELRDTQILKITGELGELRGKAGMASDVMPKLQELHEDVLNAITPKKDQ